MLDYNTQVKDPTKEFTFNLKGYIVGNAVTNWDLDCDKAYVTMGFWHGLYGKELKDKMEAGKCDYGNMEFMPAINAECMGYYNEFLTLTQKVNTYDVFRKCYTNTDDPVSFLYAEDNFGMAKVGSVDELVAAWKEIIRAGMPAEALAVMSDMSPAAYPQLKARIIPALTSKNKVDEIRLANELAGQFRAQYQKAAELARAARP